MPASGHPYSEDIPEIGVLELRLVLHPGFIALLLIGWPLCTIAVSIHRDQVCWDSQFRINIVEPLKKGCEKESAYRGGVSGKRA
jgi:hypothetical protein